MQKTGVNKLIEELITINNAVSGGRLLVEHLILMLIVSQEPGITSPELGQRMRASPASVSRYTIFLDVNRMIRVSFDLNERRRKAFELTDKGLNCIGFFLANNEVGR